MTNMAPVTDEDLYGKAGLRDMYQRAWLGFWNQVVGNDEDAGPIDYKDEDDADNNTEGATS